MSAHIHNVLHERKSRPIYMVKPVLRVDVVMKCSTLDKAVIEQLLTDHVVLHDYELAQRSNMMVNN